MGDSGFKLITSGSQQQNTVFADNIQLGNMSKGLSKDEIIIGAESLPQTATLTGADGVSIKINHNNNTTPNQSTINVSLDANSIPSTVIDKIGDQLTDKIADSLVDKVIVELESDPVFSINKAFNSYSFSNIVRCDGLFTASNINTRVGGSELCKITITPENDKASFMLFLNLVASRREGVIISSIFQDNLEVPLAVGFGYSNGSPNNCHLSCSFSAKSKNPITLSVRVGGMESGPVIINGLSNGEKILGIPTFSSISVLEVTPGGNA